MGQIQQLNKQNYKQKSTAKVPTFSGFQTMKNCNLTNRITIKSQTERKKKRKRKERSKEKNKSKRKILKEVKNIYILYNNLEKLGYYIIFVGQTRPRQIAPNNFF